MVVFYCYCFPLLLCFAAFFTPLEGADPLSYEAYPRVVEPAPRPSEGLGSAVVRARLDTGFLGFFRFVVFGRGSQGPPGPFL